MVFSIDVAFLASYDYNVVALQFMENTITAGAASIGRLTQKWNLHSKDESMEAHRVKDPDSTSAIPCVASIMLAKGWKTDPYQQILSIE
jgi:hypothetical protein